MASESAAHQDGLLAAPQWVPHKVWSCWRRSCDETAGGKWRTTSVSRAGLREAGLLGLGAGTIPTLPSYMICYGVAMTGIRVPLFPINSTNGLIPAAVMHDCPAWISHRSSRLAAVPRACTPLSLAGPPPRWLATALISIAGKYFENLR